MSSALLELEAQLNQLEPETAERLTRLFREMVAIAKKRPVKNEVPPASGGYTLPTWNLGMRADIDRDKLGQLADEL